MNALCAAQRKGRRMTTAQIGECRVQRVTSVDGRDTLHVLHADPIARITAEIVEEIGNLTARGEGRWSSIVDDVLTIKADNRTVVYVIDGSSYDAESDSYLMRWPD